MNKLPGLTRRRQVHGRRVGKPLRPGISALVEEALPRLKIPLDKPPMTPGDLFAPSRREVWLEIGFGGGEHLAHLAARHPEIGFIGCEPFINGMAKLLRRIDRDGLSNIRIHDDDARDLLDALPDGCITRIFLLYPDPWPKRRHHKRRFIQPGVLDMLARVMTSGAELHIATDIPDYVTWILYHLQESRYFDWAVACAGDWRQPFPDWPGTRYEAKALREGRKPVYLTFKRRRSVQK